jgi:hypothetical protein
VEVRRLSNGKLFQNFLAFRLVIALPIFIGMTLGPTSSRANWQEDLAVVKSDLERNQCDKAWNTLWSWARRGHRDANGTLAGALLLYGLYPPNLLNAQENWESTFLFFRLNAYSPDDGFADDISIEILQSSETTQPGGRDVAQCIIKKKSRYCRDLAVRYKIIPSISDFSRMVDRPTTDRAYCGPRR